MKTGKFNFKTMLIAAAVAAALIVSALAVELTVGWESFLGRTPKNAVTTVGESAVTGDYTFTLQETIVDDDGAAFLLALTRNDGGVIEGDPSINGNLYGWGIEVDGERPNMGSNSYDPVRSEDGKTVYYCVEFNLQQGENLQGKTITFLCDGIVDMAWSEEEIDLVRRESVSLAPMAPATKQLDMAYSDVQDGENESEILALVQDLSAQAAAPLTKMGEGKAKVSAILFTNDNIPMVAVSNSRGQVRQGQYLTTYCTALTLTDTRTGEAWGCTGYFWCGGDDGFYLCDFEGCPITEDDLAYFEVTVNYGTDKILSDEPVELSFSANEGYQTMVELDENVAFSYLGDCTAHVTGASVSALRLQLTFDQIERAGQDLENKAESETKWAVVEKDGSQILLTPPAILTDQETGTGQINFVGRNEDYERQLIDPDQVEALMVGETVIPLK